MSRRDLPGAAVPPTPRLDPQLDAAARLGLAIQELPPGVRLPGPLAPHTTLIRMAYESQLPTRPQKWECPRLIAQGLPTGRGLSEDDPNWRIRRLADDSLLCMMYAAEFAVEDPEEAQRAQNRAKEHVCAIARISDEMHDVVATLVQYRAALTQWESAAPTAIRS